MKSEDNKEFWQRWAKRYDSVIHRTSAGLYQKICQEIRPKLNRGMNVLELACGTGQLSYPLSSCVHLWEATDFSPAMITQAKLANYSVRLHFSVQDATHLPYGPESFDAVVISNALHIMPHPETALSEAERVLKPDGILFVPTFVQGEPFKHTVKIRMMELAGFHTYYKWTAEEYMTFLANNGLEIATQTMIRGGIAPLCYVEGRKNPVS